MPSQYGEHEFILRYFEGRVGRFLDVGAGDGLTLSNTEPLLRAGWSGVMLEPAISQLRWLIENHGENPNVEIIPAALGDTAGTVSLWDGRNFSTISEGFKKRIEGCSPDFSYRERVGCEITWQGIVSHCAPAKFDFINIDVEGLNFHLLDMLPFHNMPLEMVCIEIDPEGALDSMQHILFLAGLRHTKRVGGNLLAARKEIL